MQTMRFYAFYGSLRRGMPLYNQFKPYLFYQFSLWLKGFELFSLVDYPYAVRSNDPTSKILIDVFRIDDESTQLKIHTIEMQAGYKTELIDVWGVETTIYLFSNSKNDPQVKSGDWVQFFGR